MEMSRNMSQVEVLYDQEAVMGTPQVIFDPEGHELGVFLPMEDYKEMVERLEDLDCLKVAAPRLEESSEIVSWKDAKHELDS